MEFLSDAACCLTAPIWTAMWTNCAAARSVGDFKLCPILCQICAKQSPNAWLSSFLWFLLYPKSQALAASC